MSAPKFTPAPGPWEWRQTDESKRNGTFTSMYRLGNSETGYRVLCADVVNDANARLIASAPEMFEALERLARAAEIEMRDLPGPTEIDLALAASRDLLSRIRGEEVKP